MNLNYFVGCAGQMCSEVYFTCPRMDVVNHYSSRPWRVAGQSEGTEGQDCAKTKAVSDLLTGLELHYCGVLDDRERCRY